jgi:hypothetical protein
MLNRKFYEDLIAAGHVLQRDEDGSIDTFAFSEGYHNGPYCVTCHDSWCEHCGGKIEPCVKGVLDAEFVNVTNQKKLT